MLQDDAEMTVETVLPGLFCPLKHAGLGLMERCKERGSQSGVAAAGQGGDARCLWGSGGSLSGAVDTWAQ